MRNMRRRLHALETVTSTPTSAGSSRTGQEPRVKEIASAGFRASAAHFAGAGSGAEDRRKGFTSFDEAAPATGQRR